MTPEEENAHYEQNKESNIRYIRAKLPCASPRDLSLIASFIRGLHIDGWSDTEYARE